MAKRPFRDDFIAQQAMDRLFRPAPGSCHRLEQSRKFKGESVAAAILGSRIEWRRVIVPLDFLYLNPPSKRELPFPRRLNHVSILVITR